MSAAIFGARAKRPESGRRLVIFRKVATIGPDRLRTCTHARRALRGQTRTCQTCCGQEPKPLQVFRCDVKAEGTTAGECAACEEYQPKPAPSSPAPARAE